MHHGEFFANSNPQLLTPHLHMPKRISFSVLHFHHCAGGSHNGCLILVDRSCVALHSWTKHRDLMQLLLVEVEKENQKQSNR